MFQVTYTKRFVKGSIAGIELSEKLHFATAFGAWDFMNHCSAHVSKPVSAIGGADYTCHDAKVEMIEPQYAEVDAEMDL